MCQLFGMNSNTPNSVQFSFSGFSQRAGKTGDHVDGFGIAFFEGATGDEGEAGDGTELDKGVRLFVDHQSALLSPVAQMIRDYPIHSHQVISHIRKATQGRVALQNCHPFMRELWGRYWVFAHNGNLLSFNPRLHSAFRPVGDTDSERAFCWILQELAKNHASVPSIRELTLSLGELCPSIAEHGTFNFLLSNGRALWAYANTSLYSLERQHSFGEGLLADEDMRVDLAAQHGENDRIALVATEALTKNETWLPFTKGELRVFAQGKRVAIDL